MDSAINVVELPTLKRPEALQAVLDLFLISQQNGHFEALDISGTDLEEVKALAKAFEAYIVHVRPENS